MAERMTELQTALAYHEWRQDAAWRAFRCDVSTLDERRALRLAQGDSALETSFRMLNGAPCTVYSLEGGKWLLIKPGSDEGRPKAASLAGLPVSCRAATMADVSSIPSAPAFFAMAGSIEFLSSGEAYGCTCAHCSRRIAAPMSMQRQTIWCLYCGLERGFLPNTEITPDNEFEFPFFGLTAAEARKLKVVANG